MKKFVVALLVALFAQSSADALPGDPYPQVVSWVKNHKFLSPLLLGPPSQQLGHTAFRQLQDSWFIDVDLNFYGFDTSTGQKLESAAQLILLKKTYDPAANKNNAWDSRPWKDVDCKDIWKRDNPTAERLLTQIYGNFILSDFRNAKMALKKPFYVAATPEGLNLDILSDTEPAKPQEIEQWGMKKISKGDIEIFLGKKYGYIIQQGLNKDEYLFRHKCPSISIVSLAHATQSANSLSHNDRLYQQWQRQQGSKSQRLEPAPIKID